LLINYEDGKIIAIKNQPRDAEKTKLFEGKFQIKLIESVKNGISSKEE
jgi:hypothetical protein